VRKPPDPPDPPSGLTAVDPRLWAKVWGRVQADPSVKVTGFALLIWADYKSGANIRPGNSLLMRVTGIRSDKTVRDALGKMRDDWGLIWRYREGSKAAYIVKPDGTKVRPADEYRLTFPDDISGIPLMDPDWLVPDDPPCE